MGMTTAEAITLATAVIGAVLGVLNTVHGYLRDRVRLQLTISSITFTHTGQPGLCVTVINRGHLPVTITAIGVTNGAVHGQIVEPMAGQERLPYRLEARTALLWTAGAEAAHIAVRHRMTLVYADTACGVRVTGGRQFLRALIERDSI